MKLRSFRAPDLAEAMAALRTELGEDAIILSTRRVGGEVEVTAGHQTHDEPLVITPDAAPPLPTLSPALRQHNLPADLAASLAGPSLPAALAGAFRFAALPLDDGPLLLAGPPGGGKTLSCAKLATRLVLEGRPPLLITADGRRAGATEQLAAFARVLGLPLAIAASPAALTKALARRREGQPVLVDLPGCAPYSEAAMRSLGALLQAAQGVPVLVLPAGLDAEEAAETARGFLALGCRHLLPTRLDAARRLGGVLAAAAEGLALTEAGTGPDAATGLMPLDPSWLAARLEGEPGP